MRAAAKITKEDIAACHKIAVCGWIGVTLDGETFMESEGQVAPGRFGRLRQHGLVEPQADGLLEGVSQTWRLVEGWEERVVKPARSRSRSTLAQASGA